MTANIVPKITGTIQRKPVKLCEQEYFRNMTQNLRMADTIPTELETDTVHLLIGNDYYLDLILPHKLQVQPGLYLLSSQLGWILSGRTTDIDEDIDNTSMLIMTPGLNVSKNRVVLKCRLCYSK